MKRRYPVGAEYTKKGVHFRVWAPDHSKVHLVLSNPAQEISMKKEKRGYFSVVVQHLEKGSLYKFKLGTKSYPDPASRYQPFGVEGYSEVVDPTFPWTDDHWQGIAIENQIFYEMHIGTFTQEGTFLAAAAKLDELAKLGITVIEMMPVNEFPGEFGWGYDGIHLFAPYHHYGSPSELKIFIEKAHKLNIGVILDVVYNHFGPEGNSIFNFTMKYLNKKKNTEWGDAIDFDNPESREFFLTNARYWIEEFHFDGLRVDATPWFFCDLLPHVLADLSKVVKKARPGKKKIIIGESEEQDVILLKPYEENGYGFDALWNDDFHHTAIVRLKGKKEAYYTDYLGTPQEFISAFKFGFLYQGQHYVWQKKDRGTFSLFLPPSSKVVFLENHDQVANTGKGKRLHQITDPGNFRAMSCLFLLGPNNPMIFQGQEYGSNAPFYYFADHEKELNTKIHKGRKKFLSQFPSFATHEVQEQIKKPADRSTFIDCKLNISNQTEQYKLYKDLIALRKKLSYSHFDGAILNQDAFLLRYFGANDYLILINFGSDLIFSPAPEPLLVAGVQKEWEILLSSNDVLYGGEGNSLEMEPIWRIPGHSATVLKTITSRKA